VADDDQLALHCFHKKRCLLPSALCPLPSGQNAPPCAAIHRCRQGRAGCSWGGTQAGAPRLLTLAVRTLGAQGAGPPPLSLCAPGCCAGALLLRRGAAGLASALARASGRRGGSSRSCGWTQGQGSRALAWRRSWTWPPRPSPPLWCSRPRSCAWRCSPRLCPLRRSTPSSMASSWGGCALRSSRCATQAQCLAPRPPGARAPRILRPPCPRLHWPLCPQDAGHTAALLRAGMLRWGSLTFESVPLRKTRAGATSQA